MPNKQIIQHDISLQLMLRKLTCYELNLHRERSTVTLISLMKQNKFERHPQKTSTPGLRRIGFLHFA